MKPCDWIATLFLALFPWYVQTLSAAEDGTSVPKELTGVSKFIASADEQNLPTCYRLASHQFDYQLQQQRTPANLNVEVFNLRFPSPLVTEYVENNTVHAEYYRPKGDGPFPGVIVLGILGGDQKLERMQAAMLANKKIAALFVQMAYYGPRRPPGKRVRLLMPNVEHSLNAVRQSVLDIRRAVAWLGEQPEVDATRIGLMGTSLGSFVGTVAAAQEPRISRLAIILGGGGLVDAFYDHPRANVAREIYEAFGGSKGQLKKRLALADPITFADRLKSRRIVMIAARRDEVVPPASTERLWKELGQPHIHWYDATHIGTIAFFLPALDHVIGFFLAP